MTRHHSSTIIGLAFSGLMLAGCSVAGVPSAVPGSVPTTRASTSNVPSVENPLPAKVLAGSPCDTALTTADLTTLIGTPNPPTPSDNAAGPKCDWNNASGSGAHIGVTYQTKAGGGLSLDYRNIKPNAAYWTELGLIQGYPAVGYRSAGLDANDKTFCQVSVGIRDDLVFTVGMFISQGAASKGIDACTAGRDVADRVLTNTKART